MIQKCSSQTLISNFLHVLPENAQENETQFKLCCLSSFSPSPSISSPPQMNMQMRGEKSHLSKRRTALGKSRVICEALFHSWEEITVDACANTS